MSKLIIKYFSAVWCQPCVRLKPIFLKAMETNTDVKYEIIDIDEQSDLAQQMGIRAVPTIVFEKDGVVVDTLVGLHKEQAIIDVINKWR